MSQPSLCPATLKDWENGGFRINNFPDNGISAVATNSIMTRSGRIRRPKVHTNTITFNINTGRNILHKKAFSAPLYSTLSLARGAARNVQNALYCPEYFSMVTTVTISKRTIYSV